MVGLIRINKITFFFAMKEAKTQAENFMHKKAEFIEYTSESPTLNKFKTNFEELQVALNEYKNLLQRDLDTVQRIGNELVKVDLHISKMKEWVVIEL